MKENENTPTDENVDTVNPMETADAVLPPGPYPDPVQDPVVDPVQPTDPDDLNVDSAAEDAPEEPIDTSMQLTRLELARALPEVATDVETELASKQLAAFQSFKGEDGRTMNVVVVDGAIAQQEVTK